MAETFDYITVTTPDGSVQYKAPPMAAEFSASASYAAGDYCTYQGALYRFSAAHAAGAWTGTDAAVVSLAGDVSDLRSAIDLGCITVGIKDALIAAFDHVAWDDDDPSGQTYIDALHDALYNRYWQVTNTLSHCTSSNGAEQTIKGNPYTATITASAGYTLTGATVSITMGGVDVTSSYYSNGVISIPAVTGALVITISAAALTVSSIAAVYTQTGTVYDTDNLDSLKDDLVVTATYTDSSTATVPAASYTLSGTLTAGTSTITVSYGGQTTTFTVTVTHGFLYQASDGKLSQQSYVNLVDSSANPVTETDTADGTRIYWPVSSSANNYARWYFPDYQMTENCQIRVQFKIVDVGWYSTGNTTDYGVGTFRLGAFDSENSSGSFGTFGFARDGSKTADVKPRLASETGYTWYNTAINLNEWHEAGISVSNNKQTVTLDGNTIMSAQDLKASVYSSCATSLQFSQTKTNPIDVYVRLVEFSST